MGSLSSKNSEASKVARGPRPQANPTPDLSDSQRGFGQPSRDVSGTISNLEFLGKVTENCIA